jgi:hypothetical protein
MILKSMIPHFFHFDDYQAVRKILRNPTSQCSTAKFFCHLKQNKKGYRCIDPINKYKKGE